MSGPGVVSLLTSLPSPQPGLTAGGSSGATSFPHLPHPCLPVCSLPFPGPCSSLGTTAEGGEGTVEEIKQGNSGGLCSWLG